MCCSASVFYSPDKNLLSIACLFTSLFSYLSASALCCMHPPLQVSFSIFFPTCLFNTSDLVTSVTPRHSSVAALQGEGYLFPTIIFLLEARKGWSSSIANHLLAWQSLCGHWVCVLAVLWHRLVSEAPEVVAVATCGCNSVVNGSSSLLRP